MNGNGGGDGGGNSGEHVQDCPSPPPEERSALIRSKEAPAVGCVAKVLFMEGDEGEIRVWYVRCARSDIVAECVPRAAVFASCQHFVSPVRYQGVVKKVTPHERSGRPGERPRYTCTVYFPASGDTEEVVVPPVEADEEVVVLPLGHAGRGAKGDDEDDEDEEADDDNEEAVTGAEVAEDEDDNDDDDDAGLSDAESPPPLPSHRLPAKGKAPSKESSGSAKVDKKPKDERKDGRKYERPTKPLARPAASDGGRALSSSPPWASAAAFAAKAAMQPLAKASGHRNQPSRSPERSPHHSEHRSPVPLPPAAVAPAPGDMKAVFASLKRDFKDNWRPILREIEVTRRRPPRLPSPLIPLRALAFACFLGSASRSRAWAAWPRPMAPSTGTPPGSTRPPSAL